MYLQAIEQRNSELAQKLEVLDPIDEAIMIQFETDFPSRKLSVIGFRSIGTIQPLL